jgi:hypothetical protein
MTERQVIAKLRNAPAEGMQDGLPANIVKEAEVVYVLAECRKLLEETKAGDPHFALKLYCHWALHVDLAGRDTTLPFLKRVDVLAAAILGDNNFIEQHRMFREFGFLNSFRHLLRDFLASYDLSTLICDEDPFWRSFLTAYASVVEDGSLTCHSQPGDLELITGVTFTKGRAVEDRRLPFEMAWDIHLLQGKTITANVSALELPNGEEMLIHNIHLH